LANAETLINELYKYFVMRIISKKRLEKEFKVTGAALESIEIIARGEMKKKAEECLDMAKRYHNDAEHFKAKGDFASAFGALNYAHGWLDAGVRLGVFKVLKNKEYFTID